MPRFSMTSKCAVCGKEVSQQGHARQWVHENEFYAKADHPAQPSAKPYVMPRTGPEPAPARRREEPKPKAEADKPRTVAELRRRLMQGTPEAAAEDTASRKRRIAAMDAAEGQAGQSEADLAARRLRMLRMQAQQDQQR